jgi:hypothetical protein
LILNVQNEVFTLLENRQPTPTKNYKGYLVRIWRSSSQAPWRASARDTMSGEQHHFANLEKLLLFLREETTDQENSEI